MGFVYIGLRYAGRCMISFIDSFLTVCERFPGVAGGVLPCTAGLFKGRGLFWVL